MIQSGEFVPEMEWLSTRKAAASGRGPNRRFFGFFIFKGDGCLYLRQLEAAGIPHTESVRIRRRSE
jgi:hypothetical protein